MDNIYIVFIENTDFNECTFYTETAFDSAVDLVIELNNSAPSNLSYRMCPKSQADNLNIKGYNFFAR